MPWSGTGTYTRGYASWTSDASNNLPISATKFDTEDNDFAAGIQNCLTIDGQNKPNATLTWAQTLALTKGTDSTVFSIARTGGSNNPSLTWSLADSANTVTATLATGNVALVFKPSAYTVGNVPDNPTITFNSGGMTFNVNGAISAKVVSSKGASIGGNDFEVDRAGSTINTVGQGPNIVLNDTTATTLTLLQQAGGQSELWQFNGGVWKQSWTVTTANALSITDNAASPTLFNAGYMDAPQFQIAGNYQLLITDRAKSIFHNSGAPHTLTIPANASVAFPNGTMILITNATGAGNLTIAITSDTLTWANNGSTGSRTLGPAGICVIYKQFTTGWQITGPGLS